MFKKFRIRRLKAQLLVIDSRLLVHRVRQGQLNPYNKNQSQLFLLLGEIISILQSRRRTILIKLSNLKD